MSNIYWPVYKNLEIGVLNLSYSVHIDDNHLNVYSSQISDLILRASAEIESISKELYKLNGGRKTKIKYDTDALELLNSLWKLDQKVILISSSNCFQTLKELKPFIKNETSTFHNGITYTWNNSYQNLKHDRANSLQFGSIKYLFDIMSALFILNLYYKNETILLYNDGEGINFPLNMGSDLFSVKLHKWSFYDENMNYRKKDFFDECLYYIHYTDETIENLKEAHKKDLNDFEQSFLDHPKTVSYLQNNFVEDIFDEMVMKEILGDEDLFNLSMHHYTNQFEASKYIRWNGLLNKNEF
ncbi:hypothetical protein ASE21_17230 [Flavobacterium sp. Root901]|uniref:hypothetical protein n=1 Tax=Flavobacterium sp. Root901 TaxID=1736605 RepID=UPI0007091E99|nr:hypothetical protein [Flavobacterium sp. Root901]KRD07243.1 hypothetical protein ASE21_17230 [Flavobacterium sp. Root901]